MEQKIEKGIGFLQRLIALQNKYGFFLDYQRVVYPSAIGVRCFLRA